MTTSKTPPRSASPWRSLPAQRTSSGYTILELAVVIVIIGIMATATVANLSGATPRYRLRGALRELGTRVNWARSIAGGSGGTFHLHYDLDKGRTWLIHPPKEDETEDLDLELRHRSSKYETPDGVFIKEIIFPNGDRVTDGSVDLEFDPFGHGGSHIVYLENDVGGFMALKFNSILGFVTYSTKRLEFEVLR